LRSDEIYGENKYSIFSGNINPEEINQGALASCYFLCALMGLAEYDHRIKSLFITDTVNTKGAYAVKLLIQGEEKIITVDDYFPCKAKDKLPAFSSSQYGEIWLLILEKAWAKINCSCYMKTWLGTPQEALVALTKAPCIYEHHKKYIEKGNQDYIWDKIVESFHKKYVICTNTEEIEKQESVGLVPLHAYSIIKAYEFPSKMAKNVETKTLRLLKIRNPWGNKEWKGDFSANCPKWTFELKKAVSEGEQGCRTGTFYMKFEDFIKYFPWTFFCKIEENYHYCASKFKIPVLKRNEFNTQNYATAYIQIPKRTKCVICLHQPQKRFFENLDNSYKAPNGCIILAKYNIVKGKETYKHIISDFVNWEKIYLEVTLNPGEYHLFVKSNWHYDHIKPLELVISTYAEYPIEVYTLPKENIIENWFENILVTFAKNNTNKEYFHIDEDTSYSSTILFESPNNTGHGIFYYENNSTNGTQKGKLKFKKLEGARVLSDDFKSNELDITVPPMSSKAILVEFLNLPWQCQINWSHNLWFEYPNELIEKKYSSSSLTVTEKLEKGVTLTKIKHDAGYLLVTENTSKARFKINYVFRDFKNFNLENEVLDLETGYEFTNEPKSKHYLNVKYIDKAKATDLNFKKNIIIINL
jgi:calpain-15